MSHLLATSRIEIGDDVLMAWNIVIMDNDSHPMDWRLRKDDVLDFGRGYKENPLFSTAYKKWNNVSEAPIKICSRAWIGYGVSIFKGVTIGEGAVIGAGSVVTHDIPSYCLAAGNPAKVIRQLPDYSNE